MQSARRFVRLPAALVAAVLVARCSSDHPTSPSFLAATAAHPVITGVSITSDSLNVLATELAVTVTGADSVRARAILPNGAESPPAAPVVSGTAHILHLGVLPQTLFRYVIDAYNNAGLHATRIADFRTPQLPYYVQTAHLTTMIGRPESGYTIVSPLQFVKDTGLIVAYDSIGRIRWYRLVPGHVTDESKMQPNSHYTAFVANLAPNVSQVQLAGVYTEFLPNGDSVASYQAPAPLGTDLHEMWLEGPPGGPQSVFLFGVQTRIADLTSVGGAPNTPTQGHILLRMSASGAVELSFNSWDHWTIADWIEPTGLSILDFDHPNSLDFDLDSNYIVSYRHLGAIVKVNAQTGAIMWQLGGRKNQFAILNDPLKFFSGQHSVRVLPNGHLLIYDNGLRHTPPHTRAAEYVLDQTKLTATLVWEYDPRPYVFTGFVGSVQRLSNGNTVVGFGALGRVDEVTPSAAVVWSAQFSLYGSPEFYRVHRIKSLYEWGDP